MSPNMLHGITFQIATTLSEIQPETWNNIPVCLVKSMKTITDLFKVVDKKINDVYNSYNQKERNFQY